MNRLLVKGEIRDKVEVLRVVKALLLPALDLFARFWALASSSYFMELVGKLMQRLYWAQYPRAIIIEV